MRKIVFAALASAVLAAPALASENAKFGMDTVLGTTMDEVKASLTKMGYEVRKAEMEDGKIEVYFVGDGKMGEVYVSAQTGKPTKIDME